MKGRGVRKKDENDENYEITETMSVFSVSWTDARMVTADPWPPHVDGIDRDSVSGRTAAMRLPVSMMFGRVGGR